MKEDYSRYENIQICDYCGKLFEPTIDEKYCTRCMSKADQYDLSQLPYID